MSELQLCGNRIKDTAAKNECFYIMSFNKITGEIMAGNEGDPELKKFKSLGGRAREEALRKYPTIGPNDLVVVTTKINSLPMYEIEKISGDPVEYLLAMKKQK